MATPPPAEQPSKAAPRGPEGNGRAHRRPVLVLAVLLLVVAGFAVAILTQGSRRPAAQGSPRVAHGTPSGPLRSCGASCDPIDQRYLSDLHFGATSFWIQPWRAYLDTWPAARLQDALGVNFNAHAAEAQAVARLLHDSGFTLARIGTNWGGLSYEQPTRFADEADLRARLLALRDNGLRPLILLDANSGAPCPSRKIGLQTTAPAPAGARTVTLSAASLAQVVPGRSGFAAATFNPGAGLRKRRRRARGTARLTPAQRRARHAERRAARRAHGVTTVVLQGNPAILITKVRPDGVATLSRPLPYALPAGSYRGTTLLYAPFGPPTLPDGSANPEFQATLKGWLGYVAAVTRLAGSIFGPAGYDLEVWNELSFGSQFLDAAKYYSPAPAGASKTANKEVIKAVLAETLAYVRGEHSGVSQAIGVTNGFASQSPFPSGAYAPAGLTALSKHPYAGLKILPESFQAKPGRVPYDALGARDTAGPRGSAGAFTPLFVPRYVSFFPEYFLTAGSPENLVRDIAPLTTTIYKAPHGRNVATPHGRPLQVWVTEYNLGSAKAVPVGPDGVTPQPAATPTSADKAHFQAKALLRSLVAMVNKGISREYFYAATNAGDLSMISPDFMSAAVANPTSYPGDALGGETMSAFHSLLAQFQGPGPGPAGARQLQLVSIAQDGNHAQFTGDGTAAHPTLYDREVLAVLPFQSSPTRFTIPVYVMTRDLLTLYKPEAPSSDIHRFDLPDETFRITLANLPTTSKPPTISAYDPLRNETTPAKLISRTGENATIELAATDYPRILTIDYSRS